MAAEHAGSQTAPSSSDALPDQPVDIVMVGTGIMGAMLAERLSADGREVGADRAILAAELIAAGFATQPDLDAEYFDPPLDAALPSIAPLFYTIYMLSIRIYGRYQAGHTAAQGAGRASKGGCAHDRRGWN